MVGFVVLILIMLLFIFLGTIGRIGLIRGTLQAETGAADPVLWPALQREPALLLAGLRPVAALWAGLLRPVLCPHHGGHSHRRHRFHLPAAGAVRAGARSLWVVNIILEQAYVAIVKENLGIMDGWKRGWEVVRTNLGPVIIMALIMVVITFVVGLVIVLPIIVIVIPAGVAFAIGEGQNMTAHAPGRIVLCALPAGDDPAARHPDHLHRLGLDTDLPAADGNAARRGRPLVIEANA